MKQHNKNRLIKTFFISVLVLPVSAMAAPLKLETSPLFLDSSEKSNLMLIMDDSGSMDWEISIPDTSEGIIWWSTADSAFVGADQLGQINQHLSGFNWEDGLHVYLFPNGVIDPDGPDRRWYSDSITNNAKSLAVPPFIQYAFTRTAEFNTAYYNHNVTYKPWVSSRFGGTVYPDMVATNALSDPDTGDANDNNTVAFDLTQNVESAVTDHTFGVYAGMAVPAGTRYYNGSAWVTTGSDVIWATDTTLGISYFPATYYTIVSSGNYTMGGGHNCATPDPNQYVAFRTAPSSFSSVVADALAPDGRCLNKIEIKPATTSYPQNGSRTDCTNSSTCTYAEEIQNFSNWFSYHRKRYLALRAAMGETFKNTGDVFAGVYTINDVEDGSQGDVTMFDLDVATDHLSLFDRVYSIDAGGGTPNREGLDFAGVQFMRTDANAPVKNSCQKNFALQFTDGYSATTTTSGAGNADGSAGSPFADTYSDTLADIAYKYYSTTLRTDAGFSTGQIDAPPACSQPNPPTVFDCNQDLHMNTFGIVLGGIGKDIFGVNDGGVVRTTVADAHTNPPTWPDVNATRNATQIDDLYHATVNGRGEMFRATSPQELTSSLEEALATIKSQAGSASKVSFNSPSLGAGGLIYASGFSSENWSGDVRAYALDEATGDLSPSPMWSVTDDWLDKAGGLSHTARTILTFNGTQGVGFKSTNWASFSVAQKADINVASAALSKTDTEVINYLRGDRSQEGINGFRVRDSALGDFVNSNLVYVGKPPLKWPDSAAFTAGTGPARYSDYRLALINNPRKEMIYIGGNDGMLHGFVASSGDADSGKEILAYIPASIFSSAANEGLHYLTEQNYKHRFYVDLSPVVSDVILNNKWSTILIGGERSGGRGLFALDVTDPSLFGDDSTKAANTVLWEFTEADLGYTYSKPTIVKLNNGKWGAIFGNGYNSTGSGEAKLFIVELEQGGAWSENSNYYKLNTGVGSIATPNGLATPAVVDLDGNGTADRVYAGDLHGNMWAFDISNASSANWGSKYENPANTPVPLFRAQYGAVAQPITVQPIAVMHPTIPTDPGVNEPNVMLFFGTGQYLERFDIDTTETQSFYGIWDRGVAELTRSDLQAQTVINNSHTDENGNLLRLMSDNAVDYDPLLPSDLQYGWYFDLPTTGERSVLPAYVRGDLVFYNTWIPSTVPCTSGGVGYLMSVSQATGGEPSEPAFDIINAVNVDPAVDSNDSVSFGGDNVAPAGVAFNLGMPNASGFIGDYQHTSNTETVDVSKRLLAPLSGLKTGRLSWQELGRD